MSANLATTLSGSDISTTLVPNTSNISGDVAEDIQLGDRKWFIILKYTLYAIIFLISLVGNLVVCYVVSRRMKQKTVTNVFIMNLAIADLSYTLCVPLDVYATVTKAWPYGSFMCRILWPIQTLAITGSGFTLTALSVTRFWAVVKPLRRQITVKKAVVIILILWLLATGTIVPYVIYLKLSSDVDRICDEHWPNHEKRQIYTASLFVIQYAIPLIVITISYVMIGLELTKEVVTHNRRLEIARGKEAKKVIKMLVIVTLTFAILTLPSSIMWMWLDFGKADEAFPSFYDLVEVLNVLDFLNCASNPIIYTFCNESFSREFRRQLGCMVFSPPPTDSENGRLTTFVPMDSSSPSSINHQMDGKEEKLNGRNEDDETLL